MGNLAQLLKNRGRTLSDLANALDVHKATATRWNKNGVPHVWLDAIETETGIPACDLRPDIARVFNKRSVAQ